MKRTALSLMLCRGHWWSAVEGQYLALQHKFQFNESVQLCRVELRLWRTLFVNLLLKRVWKTLAIDH